MARRRFTPRAAGVVSATLALMLTLGGFIFYNTNVLNAYDSASDRAARRADYERRYGQYKDVPQPRVTRLEVEVDLYPRRRAVDVRGTFYLMNATAEAIKALHFATSLAVNTTDVRFDRPANDVL